MIDDLLALVAASGGEIAHRGRIQKGAYLLRWANILVFRDVRFTFQALGPSSLELSDALHQAVLAGHLQETPDTDPDIAYIYRLTPQGTQRRVELRVCPDMLKGLVTRLTMTHWRTLQLAATALFLQEEEGGATPRWDRAMVLCSATIPFLDRARKLVVILDHLRKNSVWRAPLYWHPQLSQLCGEPLAHGELPQSAAAELQRFIDGQQERPTPTLSPEQRATASAVWSSALHVKISEQKARDVEAARYTPYWSPEEQSGGDL